LTDTKTDRLRELAAGLGDLLASKQAQYGDSVGSTSEILRQLYPDGITPENYDGLQLVVRILDKLKRVATHGLGQDLGRENPMLDVAGYGLLGVELAERRVLDVAAASVGVRRTSAVPAEMTLSPSSDGCIGCQHLDTAMKLASDYQLQVCRKTHRPTRDAVVYHPELRRPTWCPGREETTP
jgi:hypothetical protein